MNRGVKLDLVKKFPFQYYKGGELVWFEFSSCTAMAEVLKCSQFLGQSGDRTLLQITTRGAVNIQPFSAIQSEAEFLLPPSTALKILSILPLGAGLTML